MKYSNYDEINTQIHILISKQWDNTLPSLPTHPKKEVNRLTKVDAKNNDGSFCAQQEKSKDQPQHLKKKKKKKRRVNAQMTPIQAQNCKKLC